MRQRLYASTGITGLGECKYGVTLSDTSVAASAAEHAQWTFQQLRLMRLAVNTVTGAAADVKTTYAAVNIYGLGDEAVTITGSMLRLLLTRSHRWCDVMAHYSNQLHMRSHWVSC